MPSAREWWRGGRSHRSQRKGGNTQGLGHFSRSTLTTTHESREHPSTDSSNCRLCLHRVHGKDMRIRPLLQKGGKERWEHLSSALNGNVSVQSSGPGTPTQTQTCSELEVSSVASQSHTVSGVCGLELENQKGAFTMNQGETSMLEYNTHIAEAPEAPVQFPALPHARTEQ